MIRNLLNDGGEIETKPEITFHLLSMYVYTGDNGWQVTGVSDEEGG